MAYESRLELARIQLADLDPDVVGIAAQPFQPTGVDGGSGVGMSRICCCR